MKKVLFAFSLALISLLSISISHAANFGALNPSARINLSIEAEFGRRAADGSCGPGFGICSLKISGGTSIYQGATNTAYGDAISTKDGRLAINFTKGLNTEMLKGDFMTVEQDYLIPADVAQQLGLKQSVITAGKYTLTKTSTGKKVVF